MVKKLLIIAFFVILIDRISKYFLQNADFFIFKSSINKGAAFSILQGWNLFLIIFALFVIGLILYYRNFSEQIALGLLLGGTIGNLIDRILLEGVVDFVAIWIFPVFNLADVANVIGGLLLIKYFWKK